MLVLLLPWLLLGSLSLCLFTQLVWHQCSKLKAGHWQQILFYCYHLSSVEYNVKKFYAPTISKLRQKKSGACQAFSIYDFRKLLESLTPLYLVQFSVVNVVLHVFLLCYYQAASWATSAKPSAKSHINELLKR